MEKKTKKQKQSEEKKFKAILNEVRRNLIKQNEEYFKLYLKPNDDLIKAIDLYLKRYWKQGRITKEELKIRIDERNKRVLEVGGLKVKKK